MSGIKRYLSDNAYKAAEHSESPSESNPFVTLHKAIAMRSDWNQSNSSADNYIKNKPAIKAGQGANSIIEGNIVNNVVSGGYAHAEGNGTEASGDYGSHAEGNGTTASGMCSHAEGNGTTASGFSSHAEGNETIASGRASHAEGNSTTASEENSHAEGTGTAASGFSSHAEGVNTTASGNYSHAEGVGTTASGTNSHTEGLASTASGDYSHAEGSETIANNKCQHVFGEYNGVDPSSALSSARGTYIEIVGNGTTSSARSNARTLDWSGNETLTGNLTVGGTITANGQQILPQVQVDWNQTTSTGSDYIKNKPAIKAGLGENSIVEGSLIGNSSSGSHSHAEGAGATASGPFSHAEGSGTTASGDASHAEGYNTTASGINSHAEGYMATASGGSSHAEGSGTKASGGSSHAEGSGTTASGDASHAEGYNTTAKGKSQHVFGEFNKLDPSTASSWTRGNYVEIVGNGANNTARSNARTLDWSGNEVLAGTITANGVNLNDELNLKEPLLPVTPIQPESKFLNGNRQWVEIGGGGGLTTVYKSITIENPTASENMCIFYAPVAMTITEIRGVITGATSVSFKVVSGTSRNAVTTEHNSSAVVCSSVTTGDVATITTAAVAAGSWVAVKTSAIAGAPSELVITLSLTF